MNSQKTALSFDLYNDYGISQEYSAYEVCILGVDDTAIEDFEYEYIIQGYKIFSSQLIRAEKGKYNIKLIVAKLSFIFEKK